MEKQQCEFIILTQTEKQLIDKQILMNKTSVAFDLDHIIFVQLSAEILKNDAALCSVQNLTVLANVLPISLLTKLMVRFLAHPVLQIYCLVRQSVNI